MLLILFFFLSTYFALVSVDQMFLFEVFYFWYIDDILFMGYIVSIYWQNISIYQQKSHRYHYIGIVVHVYYILNILFYKYIYNTYCINCFSPSASKAKIKEAHKRVMLLNHPDKGIIIFYVISRNKNSIEFWEESLSLFICHCLFKVYL